MYSETRRLYRGLSFLFIILYFALKFLTIRTTFGEDLIDLIGNVSLILAFLFVTLWLKRQGLYFSLFLYLIVFNFKLFINPLTRPEQIPSMVYYLEPYILSLLSIAFLLYIFASWDNSPLKIIRKDREFKDYYIFSPVIIVTILIQFIPRII
jgi:hypothetical protein